MEEYITELKELLRTLKKNPGRTYSEKTIQNKLEYIQEVKENFNTAKTEEEDDETIVALKLEFDRIYETIKEYLIKTPKEVTMTNLDMNELTAIIKLVPIFSGKREELQNFVTNLEIVAGTIAVEKQASFFGFIFKSRLDLRVQNRVKQGEVPTSIASLIESLKRAYKPLKSANNILSEITHIKQKGDNVMGFAGKIENLVTELNEIQISEEGETQRAAIISTNRRIAFNAFINGLVDPQLVSTIDASQVTTFAEAVIIAEKTSTRVTQNKVLYQNAQSGKNSYQKQKSNDNCRNCGRKHGDRCPALGVECHKCGKRGHFAKVCRAKGNGGTGSSGNNHNNSRGRNSYHNNGGNGRNNSRNVHHIRDQGNSQSPEIVVYQESPGQHQ